MPRRRAEWGLVNRVVDDADLLDAGLEVAAGIAAKSPLAVANAKQVMHRIWSAQDAIAAGLADELAADVEYCLTSTTLPRASTRSPRSACPGSRAGERARRPAR